MAQKITIAQATRYKNAHNVRCRSCRYSVEKPEGWLAGLGLPPALRLDQLEDRLKCPKCGHVGGEIWLASYDASKR